MCNMFSLPPIKIGCCLFLSHNHGSTLTLNGILYCFPSALTTAYSRVGLWAFGSRKLKLSEETLFNFFMREKT